MDLLDIAEKIGHVSTVPAIMVGAAAAWKVAGAVLDIRTMFSSLAERVSKIEGKLGL